MSITTAHGRFSTDSEDRPSWTERVRIALADFRTLRTYERARQRAGRHMQQMRADGTWAEKAPRRAVIVQK